MRSRGARDIDARLRLRGADHVRVNVAPGAHELRFPQRETAYVFLDSLRDY